MPATNFSSYRRTRTTKRIETVWLDCTYVKLVVFSVNEVRACKMFYCNFAAWKHLTNINITK